MNALIAAFLLSGPVTGPVSAAAKSTVLTEMRRDRAQAEARYAAQVDRWAQLQQRNRETLERGIETDKILRRLLEEERRRAAAPPK